MTKGDWALGLLIVPVMLPMLFSFAMTFGYALLFLGHVLVASSLGENDHPRWPEWHPSDIAEGVGRWFWAGLFGIALGGGPLVLYWMYRGDMGLLDWVVLIGLIMLGVGYAQMALAASLLHDNLIAANPVTVMLAIGRIGWDYLQPCLVAALALVMAGMGLWVMLYKMPTMWVEGAGDLGLLGLPLLLGDGRRADGGTDVPRACDGPALVPPPPALGIVATGWAALRQFVRQRPIRPCHEACSVHARAGPGQLDQQDDGDGVEDHQPGGVDQGADQRGGDDGGVDAEPSGQQRDERADAVGPDADAQDRQRRSRPRTPAIGRSSSQVKTKPSAPSSMPSEQAGEHLAAARREACRARWISPSARPRMIVPTVWLPALPPVPIKSGMKASNSMSGNRAVDPVEDVRRRSG